MADIQVPKDKIQRIPAVYEPALGALGCTKSHILALETFIASGAKTCIVFEDDFQYKNKETFWSDISKIFETELPFDVVQLSYNHLYMPELYHQVSDTEYPFLKRVRKTICSSSYIITCEFAPRLLENFRESSQLLAIHGNTTDTTYVLDVYWHSLQTNSEWYIISPSIGYQRASYSDVCMGFYDYGV